MKQLEEEIKDSIKKNLPAHVGDVLKERLEQAENDSVRVKQLTETLTGRNATITELEKQIDEYKNFDERNSALEAMEKAVADKERAFEIEKLKYELESEKDKTKFSKEVALGLVRNSEYRKTIYDTENAGSYYDSNGVFHCPSPTSKSHTETKTTE